MTEAKEGPVELRGEKGKVKRLGEEAGGREGAGVLREGEQSCLLAGMPQQPPHFFYSGGTVQV